MTSTVGNVILVIPIVFALNVLVHIIEHVPHESKMEICQMTGNVVNAYNWPLQNRHQSNGIFYDFDVIPIF